MVIIQWCPFAQLNGVIIPCCPFPQLNGVIIQCCPSTQWRVATSYGYGVFAVVVKCLHRTSYKYHNLYACAHQQHE